MTKFSVTIEIPSWLKDDNEDFVEDDYWGEHGYSCVVTHNGNIIAEHSDNGEPEDNSFGRDWSWVPDMIEKAYELGFEDGKIEREKVGD